MAPTNTLTGTTGNDILNAPGSVDTLVQGLQGNDTITLILSGDVAEAGQGNDIVRNTGIGSLANTVVGGAGNDTISFTGAAALFSGSVSGASGNDLILFSASTINGAFVGGGVGNDTINLGPGATTVVNTTVQGGMDADLVLASGTTAFISTFVGGSKGADTINIGAVGNSSSSVTGGEGRDQISIISGMSYVAGGAGTDTLNLSTAGNAATFGTVSGGGLGDVITFGGALNAGIIYGDGVGVEVAGTGTDGLADGADAIGTGGAIASGVTVFGAGGNDTINFGNVTTGTYLNGGNNADRIQILVADAAITVMGGNGADTITAGNIQTAAFFGAGAGQDLLNFTTFTAGGTVNGGAGLDTVTFTSAQGTLFDGGSEADLIGLSSAGGSEIWSGTVAGGNGADTIRLEDVRSGSQVLGGAGNDSIVLGSGLAVLTGNQGGSTINGGAGTDTISLIALGTGILTTAIAGGSAYNANVVYEAGDVISLTFGPTVDANWISTVTGSVIVLSANTTSALGTFTAMTAAGSVAVFADSTQTVIYTSATNTTTFYAINILGADLVNTGEFGVKTFNATNFGFALSNTAGSGLNITLA